MKTNLHSNKQTGRLIGMISLLIMSATFIFYIFFSTKADSFSIQVAGCILAAALCEGISVKRHAGVLQILSCVFLSAASMLFIKSILSSLVNYFTGVTMFGGTNQYGQIFTLIGMMVTALLFELISSFMPRTSNET